ncbi:MAG: hypothetical protein NTX52_10440 [Planctomycetota bacterium]|nr:hypothetical protein [Planctomycetota bacterium]MCX6778431.1 hypothetical protein [Candidatus Micrarchaeota archaeon]
MFAVLLLFLFIVISGCQGLERPGVANYYWDAEGCASKYFEGKDYKSVFENDYFHTSYILDNSYGDTFHYNVTPRVVHLNASSGSIIKFNFTISKDNSLPDEEIMWAAPQELCLSGFYSEPNILKIGGCKPKNSLYDWINFSEGIIRWDNTHISGIYFNGKNEVTFPVTIAIPQNASPGDYFGVIEISIPNKQRVYILLVLRVDGALDDKLNFEIIKAEACESFLNLQLTFDAERDTFSELSGDITVVGENCNWTYNLEYESSYGVRDRMYSPLIVLPKENTTLGWSLGAFWEVGKEYDVIVRIKDGEAYTQKNSTFIVRRCPLE